MAVAVGAVVVRGARRAGAPLRPDLPGIRAAGRSGVPLLVRTLALRAAILVTTYAATSAGAAQLAAHQVVISVWGLLALALDAIAIAAQALTGTALGAGDVPAVRAADARRWCAGVSAPAPYWASLLAPAGPVLGPAFSADPAVRSAIVGGRSWSRPSPSRSPGTSSSSTVSSSAPATAATSPWPASPQLAVYAPLALLVAHVGEPGHRGSARASSRLCVRRVLGCAPLDAGSSAGRRWSARRYRCPSPDRRGCRPTGAAPRESATVGDGGPRPTARWVDSGDGASAPASADAPSPGAAARAAAGRERSAGDDGHGDLRLHLGVQPDGRLVGAERLDRLLDLDLALVDLRAAGSLDGRRRCRPW